jgi:hypothetical protein
MRSIKLVSALVAAAATTLALAPAQGALPHPHGSSARADHG